MPDKNVGAEQGRTERLYFDDAYLMECSASVLERRTFEGHPALVLDRTCFYPESGGQPWDGGTINGVEVLKVVEDGKDILHILKEDVKDSSIQGLIDWPKRFDHMQQHTGQHILSQAFFELIKGETRSFHLGPEVSTLEIGLSRIQDEDLARIEARANEIVWENREVKTSFVPEEKISDIPLRRPPKKQGLLRIIEVADYDYSACGGTHCRRTGEVGLIKILGTEKIRGNMRFEFVCGGRALADYHAKDAGMRRVAVLFSTSEAGAVPQVEKLAEEHKSLKKRARRLEERLALFEAREMAEGTSGRIVHEVFQERTPSEARFLALNIIKSGSFVVIFGTFSDSNGHLILASSPSLNLDVRSLIPVVGSVLEVKGGGGSTLVELVTSERDKLADALEAARRSVEESLGDSQATKS